VSAALALGLLAATVVVPVGVAAQDAPEIASACAESTAAGSMQARERTGGNKQMVDLLVCAWNTANPTRQINLTYIAHDQK
jgi:multiple sugar transport system substrate-binding protein